MAMRTKYLLACSLLLIVPLVLLLTITGVRALEQRPEFCASCHEERINFETWLRSGAAKHHPTCIECHTSAGLDGVLYAQARGVVHVVKHVIGQYTVPLRGTVPRAWCTSCHVENARLQREHRRMSQFATAACAECHHHRPGASFKGEREGQRDGQAGEGQKEGKEDRD